MKTTFVFLNNYFIFVESNNGEIMIKKHIEADNFVVLLLDFNFEIAKLGSKPINFRKNITEYIKNNNIKTDNKKILLVMGGILLATCVYINNDVGLVNVEPGYIYTSYFSDFEHIPNIPDEDINFVQKEEPQKENNNLKKDKEIKTKVDMIIKNKENKFTEKLEESEAKVIVTVKRSNGDVLKLDLEEYVIGVVSAEMPASFGLEALKAQAILARTYALKSIKTGKTLTDTISTQAYIDISEMKKKWGREYSKYYNKIKEATEKTKGLYVAYNDEIIDAVYHSISNGYTEDAIEVWGYSIPYLKSVESPWDKNVTSYEKTITKNKEEISNLFGIDKIDSIWLIKKNSTNHVSEIKIGENIYSGVDIRNLLSLRSTDFDIEIKDDNYFITTRGYGHGVGMSQYGANAMAKKGYSYKKIIKYYYTGVSILKL